MSLTCPACHVKLAVNPAKPGNYRMHCTECKHLLLLNFEEDGSITAALAGMPASGAPAVQAPSMIPVALNVTAMHNVEAVNFPATQVSISLQEPVDTPARQHGASPGPAAGQRDTANLQPAPSAGAPAPDQPAHLPVIGSNYEVIKCLGKGGMGAVYLARQRSLDRPVALKIIHPRWAQDPRFLVRFTREAYAAAQLIHHNVVQVYDFGTDRGVSWFSMEYIEGPTLGDVLAEQGKLDPRTATGYILQAARGLQLAHERGMVHRDIKPDNLMLNRQGIIKVADLGLVRVPGAVEVAPAAPDAAPTPKDRQPAMSASMAGVTGVTMLNQTMGTPAFMAPEQIRSASTVDQRADIYSLGCTLYTLVTNRPVLVAKNAQEMMLKKQREDVVPPQMYVKNLPKGLSEIIMKMLARDPADRYQTTGELVRVLERFLEVSGGTRLKVSSEQADTVARGAAAYHRVQAAQLRRLIIGVALATCALSICLMFLIGYWRIAASLIALIFLTPVAYFIVNGAATRSRLFLQVRQYLRGCRGVDWLKAAGVLVVLAVVLYFLGLLGAYLLVCIFAFALAFGVHFSVDRMIARQRQGALAETEKVIRELRLRGVSENVIRKFVCQFAGHHWEEAFEELFGYEAKLRARARWSKGPKGSRPKYAAWRDPLVRWLVKRDSIRQEALDRLKLQALEQQNLEAEGMQPADAERQAGATAGAMVEKAAHLKEMSFVFDAVDEDAGAPAPIAEPPAPAPAAEIMPAASYASPVEKPKAAPPPPTPARPSASVQTPVAAPEPARPAEPREPLLPRLLDRLLGSGLRFLVGALLIVAGLAGLYLSKIPDTLQTQPLSDLDTWKGLWPQLFQAESVLGVALKPITSVAALLAGVLLLLSSFQPLRWLALLHYGCAFVMIAGPALGVPAIEPLDPALVSLAVGGGISFLMVLLSSPRRR
jgi:hypothetical protein